MKYRGVKIEKIKYIIGIDVGKMENSPIKNIYAIGCSPIGVSYPMTIKECHESIDNLIEKCMNNCNVSEKEAVKLLNES